MKGKKEPVEVFEILDAEHIPSSTPKAPCAPTMRAWSCTVSATGSGAAAKFQEALRFSPDDGPSAVYLQRCEDLMEDPPAADWDGVYVMTRK